MRISTAKWRNIEVSIDGATFTLAPLNFEDRMTIDAVISEIGRVGAARMLELSPQSRSDMVELVSSRLRGWEGVTDERGEVAFSRDAFSRYFDPQVVIWPLFWELYKAREPDESERKNSRTASKSKSSAPVTSTAAPAELPAPSPAENPILSGSAPILASGPTSR